MSKFHLEELERRMDATKACKLIMPDVLAKEREVARNKFYEYQFMSPLAATQHFAELYSQKAKAFARMHQDIETAEKVRGMGHNLFSKPSASLTEFWNTRQKADQMGVPYGLLIEFGFDFVGRRKWRTAPRPGQLFGSKNSGEIWLEMFESYAEEHLPLFTRELGDLPQYRSENYRGLQSQDDFREFIRETIARPGQQWDRKIMQNCIERRYLPLSQTLYMVPKDLRKTTIESVRSNIRRGEFIPAPIEKLSPISLVPSCCGIPSALDHTTPECSNCPFAELCTSMCETVGEHMVKRFGSLSPLKDSRDEKRKEGQRRRTARHRAKQAELKKHPGSVSG